MTAAAPVVFYADGPDAPLPEPSTVARLAGLGGATVWLGWTVRRPAWLDAPAVPVATLMSGVGTRAGVEAGTVAAVATRLSAIPGLLAGRLRPDVAVVGAYETGAGWVLAGSPGLALAAARLADRVVIERWSGRPPRSAPALPVGRPAAVIDRTDPPDKPPENRAGPAHAAIGRLVAGLIPEGATIQWGPGAVGAAVVAALDRPVQVRSGLVTDELADLAERGLLVGTARSAYLWGGDRLRGLVESGRLRLEEVSVTHDITDISATARFVAINTALQVGLDGAANVEVAGGRIVSGPGGHPDFAAGASRSPGGLSIVALPSVAAGRSTIVATPEVVSTPRCDVDVVVTEHGVADLRGLADRERARRLIAIASPEHREDLVKGSGAPR